MTVITIHDMKDRVLALDLRDLLRILAPLSQKAEWTVTSPAHSPLEATGAGAQHLEELAQTSKQVSGRVLLSIADSTQQVIWGNFIGILPDNPDREWLTIRAFDSSFFEVETSDDAAIKKIRSCFRDTRIAMSAN